VKNLTTFDASPVVPLMLWQNSLQQKKDFKETAYTLQLKQHDN